jgi:hypothetical protein
MVSTPTSERRHSVPVERLTLKDEPQASVDEHDCKRSGMRGEYAEARELPPDDM